MNDPKPIKIALTEITNLEQGLDQVPARNATEISKGRAIAMIAPKLQAMRGKGYAWRDIAVWLTEHGVPVTASALQRYLRAAKPAGRAKPRSRPARGLPPREVPATEHETAAHPTAGRSSPPSPTPKTALSAGETPARSPAQPLLHAGFTPRRRDPEGL